MSEGSQASKVTLSVQWQWPNRKRNKSESFNFLFNMVSWCGGHRRVHVGNYLVLCICLCIFQPPQVVVGVTRYTRRAVWSTSHSQLPARPLASNPFMLCPIYASSGHLVFSSFGQICFGIWTNTVFNLDKYIWQFGQSGLHSCWVVSTQPLVSGHPLLSLTDLIHTRQYLRLSNWKSDSLREEILATNSRNIIRNRRG